MSDDFNKVGDTFVDTYIRSKESLLMLPGQISTILSHRGLGRRIGTPVREGRSAGEQRVRDFVNDYVAMMGANASMTLGSPAVSAAMSVTHKVAKEELEPHSAPLITTAEEVEAFGYYFQEANNVLEVCSLPRRVQCMADLQALLAIRQHPALHRLREHLDRLVHPARPSHLDAEGARRVVEWISVLTQRTRTEGRMTDALALAATFILGAGALQLGGYAELVAGALGLGYIWVAGSELTRPSLEAQLDAEIKVRRFLTGPESTV